MNHPPLNTSPALAAAHVSPSWQIKRVHASVDSVVFHLTFAEPIELTQTFLYEFRLAAERAPDDATWRPKFEMDGQLATGVLVRYESFDNIILLIGMLDILRGDGLCVFVDVLVASVDGRVTLQLQEDHSFADAKLLAGQMAMMIPGSYDTRHLTPSPWIGGMGYQQGVNWRTYAVPTQSRGAQAVTFAFQAEVKDALSGRPWMPENLHTLDFRHLLYPVRLAAAASSASVDQLKTTRSLGDRVVAVLSLVRWPSRKSRRISVPQHAKASGRGSLTSKYLNKRLYDSMDRLTTRVHRY